MSVQEIERALRVFACPGQVVELRAINVQGRKAVCEIHADLPRLARRAAELDAAGAQGVYFTPNPLRGGLSASSKAEDVEVRHWLLIDCDPARPSGTSATDAEKASAWRVLSSCRSVLEAAGLRGEVIDDSGNGWHLCYPIQTPNDDASHDLIRDFLKALQDRCGDRLDDRDRVAVKARQFLPTPKATVGVECHDANRIWKLPGTTARKGAPTPDRPHRTARLVEGQPWQEGTARHNTSLLPKALRLLLETYDDLDHFAAGYRPAHGDAPSERELSYCRKGLEDEAQKVARTAVGTGLNSQLNESAFAVGQLVGPGRLGYDEAFNRLYLAALDAGANDPRKDKGTISRGLKAGMQQPRQIQGDPGGRQPTPAPNADNSADPLDQDATAADLIRVNATIRWGWPKWLQIGVLNVLASEPGVGKTRFCADLARRVYHGLPWPDGTPATCRPGSPTLWVPADNQHAELATLAQTFGFPPEALFLNATRRNPFAGTMLDDPADLREFEARIRRVRPAVVIVDTSLNATDRSAHKPEDAKAFFVPLQQIAARAGTLLLMVTHLNAAGKPLGRRIQGQARLVMQLEKPDPDQEHRRKLHVVKSNALYPAPLGVTMGDTGNEYDDSPPAAPEPGQDTAPGTKLREARQWLTNLLNEVGGSSKVGSIRTEAEMAGINARALYAARDAIGVEEFVSEGKKWWRLTSTNGTCD